MSSAKIVRIALTGALLYKVAGEVGPWTLTFLILVAITIELQAIIFTTILKKIDTITNLILKKKE